MSQRLLGKVAIVTGGGHGIGKAYARRLAEEGARVVIAELDEPACQRVAEEMSAQGWEVLGIPVDVREERQLQEMAEKALNRFGRIDVLVNNAAVFATIPISRTTFDRIDPKEWDLVMEVNVKGTWLACRAVAPVMQAQRSGKIINIASGTAFHGRGGRIHYISSKAAILGFTKALARELGDFNINVNCIAPGSTLSEENPDEQVVQHRLDSSRTRVLKRVQTPADLLGALVFLASSESDFITGQTLVVDGGNYMH
ncbi:MAG: 3-oxoacyl-ACP reductase FabG [Alicyclobacillus sp.]|nr:3-oxoacyl-ACP reductase FabG [Alicyclobacillus sp.]